MSPNAQKAPHSDGAYSQIMWMALGLWPSRQRNKILMLIVALVGVVAATAYMQVRLNAWNKPFYNSLANKDIAEFFRQLGVFAELAGILLVLNVAQTSLNQTSKVILRQRLVGDLMTEWLAPLRAFRLTNAGDIGVNPDQRTQQDAQHLTELTTDLGIGLLQSSLLLLSFIWRALGAIEPHSLVHCGAHICPSGLHGVVPARLCRARVVLELARRPPPDQSQRGALCGEAEFRFALVRVSEDIEGVTLSGGEADERERLEAALTTVITVSGRIVGAVTRLTWVTPGYGWFTIAAPILVAARAYFDAEKQCLAFARVILHRPTWIVLNDALDVLDSESRRRIEALFSSELANVGVINIGHAASEMGLYARTLYIASDPLGPTIELNSQEDPPRLFIKAGAKSLKTAVAAMLLHSRRFPLAIRKPEEPTKRQRFRQETGEPCN